MSARRGCFKKLFGVIASVFVFTLIGGGLGAFIPWYMERLTFDSESLSGILYQTGKFNQFFAHLLSSLIMDLPDKAITVLLVVIILSLIPKQFYKHCSFVTWMQAPMSDAKLEKKGKKNVRVISLRAKLLIVFTVSLFVVAFVGTVIGVNVYYRTIIREHESLAMGTVTLASKVINGDKVDEYLMLGGSAEGESYLKEARNMAAYHHERWDGKGYPEKLHGEAIPLSARIMAVADVFDALTSPRVYKPPFSLEKALAIIEEGKGTQFDPKCVEVFMESIPEVKEILTKHNHEYYEEK